MALTKGQKNQILEVLTQSFKDAKSVMFTEWTIRPGLLPLDWSLIVNSSVASSPSTPLGYAVAYSVGVGA